MTSELFPELTIESLHAVLRNNARLDSSDDISLETAAVLQDLGLVEISQRDFVLCINPKDVDYYRLSAHQRLCDGEIDTTQNVCPQCGRQIEDVASKEHFTATYISLEYQGVVIYIGNTLRQLSSVRRVNQVNDHSFTLELNNNRLLTVIILTAHAPTTSRYYGLYFGDAYLYIYVPVYERPASHLLSENKILWLGDFLSLRKPELENRIVAASAHLPLVERKTLHEWDSQFEKFVMNISWQDFEKAFIPSLLKRIIESPDKITTYLDDLSALDRTILGTFPVSVGGAGETDIRLISKLEIMSTVFASRNLADAKRFSGSTLITADHVRDVLIHLNQVPVADRASAIIFASTNEIQSAAWAQVCRFRDAQHYWQIVIIPRFLLLELLAVFDAYDLIE